MLYRYIYYARLQKTLKAQRTLSSGPPSLPPSLPPSFPPSKKKPGVPPPFSHPLFLQASHFSEKNVEPAFDGDYRVEFQAKTPLVLYVKPPPLAMQPPQKNIHDTKDR